MDFESTLRLPLAQKILGHHLSLDEDNLPFAIGVVSRIDFLLRNPENVTPLAEIGNAALNAFLQCNVTGPPLSFDSIEVIFPKAYRVSESSISDLRHSLLQDLSIDGEAIYQLIPSIELFWLAKRINNHDLIAGRENGRRQRARTNFVHQRLLFEDSELLRESIYSDLENAEQPSVRSRVSGESAADFLIEKATVDIFYGHDAKARENLGRAAKLRDFQFALTGRLGRKTKFQQFDLSQLVVLARSAHDDSARNTTDPASGPINEAATTAQNKPQNLALNDDTLLESISFTKNEQSSNLPAVEEESSLPSTLASLDPADQPLLSPQDSIILLSIASSITNTSPSDGLTREETLPYAVRVLDGGSSNWQIYTQALLVRSRIEGYNSRTAERGLLQLQALVDQVIADTTVADAEGDVGAPSTFLPRPKANESASAEERLKYIFSLASPFRWTLEAELAQRWVSMGGLRSALEIYERLQMWPEVALCFAATDQESQAISVIRKLLYEPSEDISAVDGQSYFGPEMSALPSDAPRLFCILGDLEPDLAIQHYTRAWEISKHRYARAQRSLARLYTKQKSYPLAAEAYEKSLHVNRLNASTWFALGCVQLELEDYAGAATCFTQMVQLEESDAEAWSNLAVALLRLPIDETSSTTTSEQQVNPYHNRLSALRALQRATSLKPTDSRLWDNYLTVSSSLPPSLTPWSEIIRAQSRLLSLQKSESAIDTPILTRVLNHITTESLSSSDKEKSFLTTQLSMLFTTAITPLITTKPELWYLSSRLWQHLSRPAAALDAEEKAWRIITSRAGVYETEKSWSEVVDATIRLAQKYRELGPMRKEGLANNDPAFASSSPEQNADEVQEFVPVARDYLFKARSAVRSVLGKGKAAGLFEDSEATERLQGFAEELKGGAGR